MRTVGEALIAKMASQTLTLSSSSHSSNKKKQTKNNQTKMMRQQSRKSYQEEDRTRFDLPNKICGSEQQADEYLKENFNWSNKICMKHRMYLYYLEVTIHRA